MANYKEIFVYRTTNAAQFDHGTKLYFNDIANARQVGALPHQGLTIANLDSTSTLYIWLDDDNVAESPDYILFPNQVLTINPEEGIHFQQAIVKNTHASNDIAANLIKVRISTAGVV